MIGIRLSDGEIPGSRIFLKKFEAPDALPPTFPPPTPQVPPGKAHGKVLAVGQFSVDATPSGIKKRRQLPSPAPGEANAMGDRRLGRRMGR